MLAAQLQNHGFYIPARRSAHDPKGKSGCERAYGGVEAFTGAEVRENPRELVLPAAAANRVEVTRRTQGVAKVEEEGFQWGGARDRAGVHRLRGQNGLHANIQPDLTRNHSRILWSVSSIRGERQLLPDGLEPALPMHWGGRRSPAGEPPRWTHVAPLLAWHSWRAGVARA